MAELQSGQLYHILSLLEGARKPAGINTFLPVTTQVVRLGSQDHVWEITKKGEGLYQFSVKPHYPFSGEEHKTVIASQEPEKNLLWHVTFRPSNGAWTIERHDNHDLVWTVAREDDPESEIVIEKIKYLPIHVEPPSVAANQLFRVIPANY